MRQKGRFPLLLLGCVLAAGCSAQSVPTAGRGVIDVREWDFGRQGTVELTGDWIIYWENLLTPADLPERDRRLQESDGFFGMPSTWNDWEYEGATVGGMGYATFLLELLLPPGMERAALWIPNASTAYRLWVDTELRAESGTPGVDRGSSRPHYIMNTAEFDAPAGRATIVLQVSNFHHRRGGMWKAIKLGTPGQIRRLDATETMYDLLLLGNFIAMALYNFFLSSSQRRADVIARRGVDAPLLLGIAFLALIARVFVTGQILVTRLVPGFPWWLQLRIEYLSAHVVFVVFAWIADRAYPGVIARRVVWGITAFVACNAAVTLFFPVLVYSRVVTSYNIAKSVVLLAMTVRFVMHAASGRREAWTMVGAIAIFFLITFSEMIHYREIVLSRDFAPVGFIVALFGGGSRNETLLYLASTVATLGVMVVIFNLFVFKVSQSFLHLEMRLAPLDPKLLSERYHVTARESEILRLVAVGKSNKEIAADLSISEGTVKNHLYRAMRKLDVGNRTEIAIRLGPLQNHDRNRNRPTA